MASKTNKTQLANSVSANSSTIFVDYWDIVIKQWLRNNFNCSELMEQKKIGIDLGIGIDSINNRLPEPYWGNPDNCSFVIMGYNPGPCHDSRHNYRFCADSYNSMIYEIKRSKYSVFAKSFPLYRDLTSSELWFEDSIGREWWQKQKDKWIDCLLKKKETKKLPFAMEFCAWHSDEWKGLKAGVIYNNIKYYEILINAFIEAIKRSDCHVGICFGCEFRNCKTFVNLLTNRGFSLHSTINGHIIYTKGADKIVLYCKGDRQRYPSTYSEINPVI